MIYAFSTVPNIENKAFRLASFASGLKFPTYNFLAMGIAFVSAILLASRRSDFF